MLSRRGRARLYAALAVVLIGVVAAALMQVLSFLANTTQASLFDVEWSEQSTSSSGRVVLSFRVRSNVPPENGTILYGLSVELLPANKLTFRYVEISPKIVYVEPLGPSGVSKPYNFTLSLKNIPAGTYRFSLVLSINQTAIHQVTAEDLVIRS